MKPIETAGGWYCDALPDGSYVELVTNSHLNTSFGRVELPQHQNLLYVTLAPNGVRFAGVGHQAPVKDMALEWTGSAWQPEGLAVGTQPVIYDASGLLHISNGSIGAQGWRQVGDDGRLITGDASTADVTRQIWNYTTYSNWTIGQGGEGPDGDDPLIALYLGRRILLQRGRCRSVRFRLAGPNFAIAWVQEDRNSSCRWFGTVDELLAMPDQATPGPPPPPHVDPPAVTILFYPQSVQLGDPAHCIADLTGGPAERLIWLFRKAGDAHWQIAAVNVPADPDHTYIFQTAGEWEIAASVEGPGGSNQTATRRVVHVEGDVPERSDRFWFCPDMASDLVALFAHPEQWAAARAHIGVFQFYAQQIMSAPDAGPNTYDALVAVDAFRKLKAWGIATAIEGGAMKEWDCTGEKNRAELPTLVQRVRAAGGEVTYITMDDPLVAAQNAPPNGCGLVLADPDGDRQRAKVRPVAAILAAYIKAGDALGVKVGLIEAWPRSDVSLHEDLLDQLDDLAQLPRFWHLDIDRHDADKTNASIPAFIGEVRRMARQYGMPYGVALVGYGYASDAEYAADVRAWATVVHAAAPDLPHVKIQSWARRLPGLTFDLPHNLPETTPDTHTALVNVIAEQFS